MYASEYAKYVQEFQLSGILLAVGWLVGSCRVAGRKLVGGVGWVAEKELVKELVELGQGGFGSAYKGKLPNGCLVAMKVLSESKGNGEEFMNEVASISRTSYVNIVTLLGFCSEKSKRALVYEFMPNGSLDKFIYRQGSHRRCTTRIFHFHIKSHNILLDESFCPKISDFGLSKLCKRKESTVSMNGARGTAGYIAPEVFSPNFGGASHKSHVYSYGMMVMEMVGGRKNIDHLDQDMNLSLDGVTAEEEEEITRKLIVVSLWCIQSDPTARSSMTKVAPSLQGNLQSLEIPPRPFVSSPIRSPKTDSTTHTWSLM
ncbi:rust resistance kinase Lr10-like [Durio zibethinus]|uniref:Rust resistance kinase Lr10-like n=1 Tax=Durio zibethinus TaxID=66656 RepID=A0A6P6AXG6_DURZI|nr:rust resistance kinase Lr10-like [Durio zibethinus]